MITIYDLRKSRDFLAARQRFPCAFEDAYSYSDHRYIICSGVRWLYADELLPNKSEERFVLTVLEKEFLHEE